MEQNSLLKKFDLSNHLFENIAENIDNLQSTARTQMLVVDKPVQFTGSINGVEIPAEVTLRSASLSRFSVLKQESIYKENYSYLLVTGVLNPVKLDINVMVEDQKLSLVELIHSFVGTNIEKAKFEASLMAMGLNFNNAMPLFFQQFGASEAGIIHALETFKKAGAVDVLGSIKNQKRIISAYQHKTGVPLTSFELGTVDREKSRTKQGFVNLVDAAVSSYMRVATLRLEAHALAKSVENMPQAKTKIEDEIKLKNTLSRQWVTNWSGSQQRIEVLENGTQVPQQMYDPVNAPCGRFTMVVNGEEIACDLWSNSAVSENVQTLESNETTTEQPF